MRVTVKKYVEGLYGRCLYASVEIEGYSLSLSKYPDESEWFLDSKWTDSGIPIFAHGIGARSTKKHVAIGRLRELLEITPLEKPKRARQEKPSQQLEIKFTPIK